MKSLLTAVILLWVTEASALHARRTNRTCTSSNECLPAHSTCYQSMVCMCDDGYVAVNRKRNNDFECLKIAKGEGDWCSHDLQCEVHMGRHSECVLFKDMNQGECHCKQNHHNVRGLCHPTSHIGDSCKVSDDCYLKRIDIVAYCQASVCICPPGFHPSIDRKECLENKGLHGPCQDDEDCKFPNTMCQGLGYCICQEDYELNADRSACEARARIPITQLGQTCSSDDQCTTFIKESMCDPVSKTCICSTGAQQINSSCYHIARLGDKCSERLECVIASNIERVDCIGNICACNPPYKRNMHDCVSVINAGVQPSRGTTSSPHLQVSGPLTVLCLLLARHYAAH
uniref:EB domain-containing protein n=3 Tax=Lygus hesperus TaxID=30085 RepID=A0A146M9P6_LYGHE